MNDQSFALKMRMLPALAFVRPGDVNDYFGALEEIFPANAEVVTFFEQYYIGTLRPNGQRRTPLSPQRLLNVFNKALEGHPRTNNSQEGWHRHFSSQVPCHHPSIWKFIDAMAKEEEWA